MSFTEILKEIPKLSFVERQELVRQAIGLDDGELSPEKGALLDARMEDFQRNPEAGTALDDLKDEVQARLSRR